MAFFGLFGGDKKKEDTKLNAATIPSTPLTPSSPFTSQPKISKEKKVELSKRKIEISKICTNKGITATTKARVALVLDFSYSMSSLYSNGTVQTIVERILPLGLQFDDDEQIDIFVFADGRNHHFIGTAGKLNFSGYVDAEIMNSHSMGGTSYAPVMERIVTKYTKEAGDPAFIIFITDGDCWDADDAEKTIKKASKYPIFWQFIGIGYEKFAFLQKLDTMSGRVIDNANFFKIDAINEESDTSLYNKMMGEFPDWLKLAKTKGIIK